MTNPCFPEPVESDDTWADHGETLVEWIQRSTLPRAAEVRRFVNANLDRLPSAYREGYCHALRVRWNSALFELVLARMVQLLGGEFVAEAENPDGRRPDLGVTIDDERVVIEAIAPEFDLGTTAEAARHVDLLRIIEGMIPAECSALISTLPGIGPSDSKKPFKRSLQDALAQAREVDARGWQRISFRLEQGELDLTLVPREMAGRPIAGGPTYVSWSDAEGRIKHALATKRSQVRAETDPVILAVLSSAVGGSFGDFDRVLFGHSVSRVDLEGRELESWFEADGALARRSESPTYAGVLAMASLTPFGCAGPVLYIHPETEALPAALTAIERRVLVPGEGVRIIPAENPDLLNGLPWAEMDPS